MVTVRDLLTVRDLRVYRVQYSRHRQTGPSWNATSPAWAVAAPSGAVLVYAQGYPSTDLLEDCCHALNNA